MSKTLTIVFISTILFLNAPIIWSTVIHVPSEQPTIQAGVDAAVDGDTVLIANGTYSENVHVHDKELLIASSYILSNDTLDIQNTLLDYPINFNQCFGLSGLVGLTVGTSNCDNSNIFITDCRTRHIHCHSSSLSLSNCEISYGASHNGGGINAYQSRVSLDRCLVYKNTAMGGEEYCGYHPIFEYPLYEMGPGRGGAIYSFYSSLFITNSTLACNSTLLEGLGCNPEPGPEPYPIGTAIDSYIGNTDSVIIKNSIIYNNIIDNNDIIGFASGEALYIFPSYYSQSSYFTISNCYIFNNGSNDVVTLYAEQYEKNNIFFADPLFCDAANGDFHIDLSSPCAPLNNISGELIGALGVGCSLAQSVYLDIKPGSCPNPINMKRNNGKAVFPTAILGTEDFDVHDIDPSTIALLGVYPTCWSYEDVSTPFESEDCECSEEGPDGFTDLTLKFDRNSLLDTLLNLPFEVERELFISGMLNDSTEFEGSDCVKLLKNGRMPEFVELEGGIIPINITLVGNHPNPFNPTTTISYGLPSHQKVTIEIFNMLGQKVSTLIDKSMSAGYHTVEWDASRLPSGIYLYRLVSEDFIETKKMILLK